MFYIYGRRRDDLTKFYWNRRKNDWTTELTAACHYPTAVGVNRIYQGFINNGLVLGRRFHELGFNRVD